jgi:hypothetical protein
MDSKQHLQKLINVNLDYVGTEILPMIGNQYAQVSAQEVLERLKATVVAVTDDNSADKDQISLIWGSLSSDPEIVEAVRGALLEAVSKIDEPQVQEALKLLMVPVLKTLTAVTDQVKPDGAQLKAIWKSFVESPEFLAFLLSNLGWVVSKVVKDQKAQDWILKLLSVFTK